LLAFAGLPEDLGNGAKILLKEYVAALVEDAHVHRSGMEIDAGIVSVGKVLVATYH
jgi:hypothetical protein